MKFVDPKNDVAFKKIFGSEDKTEILIAFLNAILDLHGDEAIKTVRQRSPYQTPELAWQKQSILDIYAADNRGYTFIVEMQVANVKGIKKRFTYYIAQEYSSQIDKGKNYITLNPVIFIEILDFELFEDPKKDEESKNQESEQIPESQESSKPKRKHEYLHCHKFLDSETYVQEFSDMELYFIQLPNFKKQPHELSHLLDKWVYFIKHAENLDVIPEHVEEPELQAAYEEANQFGWTRLALAEYEHRNIRIQDERGAITLAEDVAEERGVEKGIKKGRAEGIQLAKLEMAQNLLSIGLPIDQIVQASGLSIEQIQ